MDSLSGNTTKLGASCASGAAVVEKAYKLSYKILLCF